MADLHIVYLLLIILAHVAIIVRVMLRPNREPGALPPGELAFITRMLEQYGAEASATLVFSHLPMWPLAKGREHEIIDDRDLLNVMHRYGVDVFASGHHHAFFAGIDDMGMVHLGKWCPGWQRARLHRRKAASAPQLHPSDPGK